eukprot:CAMPEP_0115378574 /NCGR_PEP_ID=MMETSP0271-20121206/4087_1 /TAXON_ID=71861 /ORGANISM="Scrippsiella trochoidea, Strain CCMP3099" /LENGTH=84 /DNA_ID=CAMNT_0002801751 /DNA_START=789 /DNA_END=1044 /DNA_ORIENTATION=+
MTAMPQTPEGRGEDPPNAQAFQTLLQFALVETLQDVDEARSNEGAPSGGSRKGERQGDQDWCEDQPVSWRQEASDGRPHNGRRQ